MEIPDEARRAVEQALGETVVGCRVPATGAVADTYVLEFEESLEAVCKCGGASIWTTDVIEPEVVRFVGRNASVPVPSVLASGPFRDNPSLRRWALYEYVDGTVPRDVLDRPALLAKAGTVLGRVHAETGFERVGGLTRTDGELELAPPRRSNLLAGRSGSLLAAGWGGSLDWQPVLTHGDFHPGNLLVADGEIRAVLDWGNAHVTDAGYALARAETRFVDLPLLSAGRGVSDGEWLREQFREGYTSQAPLPESYRRLRSRFRLTWLGQSAINLARVAASSRGRTQLRRQCLNWLSRRFDRRPP